MLGSIVTLLGLVELIMLRTITLLGVFTYMLDLVVLVLTVVLMGVVTLLMLVDGIDTDGAARRMCGSARK